MAEIDICVRSFTDLLVLILVSKSGEPAMALGAPLTYFCLISSFRCSASSAALGFTTSTGVGGPPAELLRMGSDLPLDFAG